MRRWCLLLSFAICPVVAKAATADEPAPRQLVVASVQLPAAPEQWLAQRDAIAAKFQVLQPDVIAVQRVYKTDKSPPKACWLADVLGYTCTLVTSTPPSHPERHGSALLTRHPVLEDGLTLLHPVSRYSSAGMVRLQLGDQPINIYIVNLADADLPASALQQQSDDLRAWIAATADGLPTVIAGAFALPAMELAQRLSGFQAIRRNPRSRAADTDGNDFDGWDVLYRVRQFADVSQKRLNLPVTADNPRGDVPFGVLATLRLQVPVPLHGSVEGSP